MSLELRLALRALQVLAKTSRCWSSRQAAALALRTIARVGELDVDELGLPEDVELARDERPDHRYSDVGNYLNLWGT